MEVPRLEKPKEWEWPWESARSWPCPWVGRKSGIAFNLSFGDEVGVESLSHWHSSYTECTRIESLSSTKAPFFHASLPSWARTIFHPRYAPHPKQEQVRTVWTPVVINHTSRSPSLTFDLEKVVWARCRRVLQYYDTHTSSKRPALFPFAPLNFY